MGADSKYLKISIGIHPRCHETIIEWALHLYEVNMQSKRDIEKEEALSFEVCERCGDRIPQSELSIKDGYCGDCRNRITGE